MVVPRLSLAELQSRARVRSQNRQDSYDRVLHSCHNRIRRASENGNTACIFDAPVLILGLPLLQTEACVAYIKQQLERTGLCVHLLAPSKMLISWSDGSAADASAGRATSARVSLPW